MRQDFFSIAEFCQHYDIAESTFHREVSLGRLQTIKRGFRTFINPKEARRWNRKRHRTHVVQCCRRAKRALRRRKTFSLGACFKLFFRKWK